MLSRRLASNPPAERLGRCARQKTCTPIAQVCDIVLDAKRRVLTAMPRIRFPFSDGYRQKEALAPRPWASTRLCSVLYRRPVVRPLRCESIDRKGGHVRVMEKPLKLQGGDYDISRKDDLRAELNHTEPHSDVVLDLALTDYIDCSCLGVMIMQLRTWREQVADTNLRLQNVAPSIVRILGLLELDRLFVIESVQPNN